MPLSCLCFRITCWAVLETRSSGTTPQGWVTPTPMDPRSQCIIKRHQGSLAPNNEKVNREYLGDHNKTGYRRIPNPRPLWVIHYPRKLPFWTTANKSKIFVTFLNDSLSQKCPEVPLRGTEIMCRSRLVVHHGMTLSTFEHLIGMDETKTTHAIPCSSHGPLASAYCAGVGNVGTKAFELWLTHNSMSLS